jgi:serine/threonine protein kinase
MGPKNSHLTRRVDFADIQGMAKEEIPFDVHATGMVDLQAAAGTKVGGGRYALRRVLGRGGMGVVWLGFDERLAREVALKFLPFQIRYDAVALDDLRRETARSQALSHPNIVRIHDLYEAEREDPFISMEYVDGSNLAHIRVQRNERVLDWAFLEPLVQQLCDALEYAHSEGIVHRDLKPANLMVDQTGRLKLADFGIARAVTDTMSRASAPQTSGTLLYMSPQQLEGGPAKRTDDVYGLGACLYELLTSKPPFYSGELLHQIRNRAPQPLSERVAEFGLNNDIPPHVNDIVLACLDKDERQRPGTAGEVAESITARRAPIRTARPKRPAIGLAALRDWRFVGGAVAAIAVLALTGWLIRTTHSVAARLNTDANTPLTSQPVWGRQGLVPSGVTSSEATALELVARGNSHLPERSKNKLIRAISSRSPAGAAPQRWRLLYYDPNALYDAVELRFERGQMARVHEPTRLLGVLTPQSSKPLEIDRMRIDSDKAQRIVFGLPGISAKSFELELERGANDAPVWRVRLFETESLESRSIGHVLVAADDGRVLRQAISK